MKIGFIGLGKLGFPVALAIESKGHEVWGYDVNKSCENWVKLRKYPHTEAGLQSLLDKSNMKFGTLEETVNNVDLIFLCIQTPHSYEFEGITRLPDSRKDFDYQYLVQAIKDINGVIKTDKPVVVISTVLPGTLRREIVPIASPKIKLCYGPLFPGMGTVLNDFLYPEFVLLGRINEEAAKIAKKLYSTITNATFCEVSLEEAELTKVAYNCFISLKINYVNQIMEICHKVGGLNVENVMKIIKLASSRLISTKYLSPGMPDAGNCHPRDLIAMSKLARVYDLSYDLFGEMMLYREKQIDWMADLIIEKCMHKHSCRNGERGQKLPVVILGRSFKPESSNIGGSNSLLLFNILREKVPNLEMFITDPYTDFSVDIHEVAVYFVATKHEVFSTYKFPAGSIVIDPWRYILPQTGITLVPIGIS